MRNEHDNQRDDATSDESRATDEPQATRGAPASAEALAQAQQRAAEWEDRCKRATADLENARKRHERELEEVRTAERARVVSSWLPIIDNLELALSHADADPKSIIDGVRAVRAQAVELLASMGYPRQEDDGVPFDPNRHEVVGVVKDTQVPPDVVVQVLRPGYGIGNRQLRPAAVTVARPPE
jgi:molecular chaperone GrpE